MPLANRNGLQNKSAVILAGGESRRFGSNKAFARIGDQTFLEKLIETLTGLGFDIFLSVSDSTLYKNFSFKKIRDFLPKEGPLQALDTVFSKRRLSRCLFLSCDIPFISPEILQRLWKESSGVDICLLSREGIDQPFPAVYSIKVAHEAKRLLRAGKRDLKSLLNSNLKIKRIWDAKKETFFNLNTEEERHQALSIFLGKNQAPERLQKGQVEVKSR